MSALSTTRTNTTSQLNTHPDEHNLLAGFVNNSRAVDGINFALSGAGIQAAIDELAALGGGEVVIKAGSISITATITGKANVKVRGQGAGFSTDGGTDSYGTRLIWTGAAGGTMWLDSATSGAGNPSLKRPGIEDIRLDAASTADYGLVVKSVHGAVYRNLTIYNARAFAIDLNVVAALAEARDTQDNLFENINVRVTESTNAGSLRCSSTGGAGANPSLNTFDNCNFAHIGTAVAISLLDADNNVFFNTRIARVSGAAVGLLADGAGTVENNFYGLSAGPGGLTQQNSAAKTGVYGWDVGNGAPKPVLTTGALVGMTQADFIPAGVFKPIEGAPDEAARGSTANGYEKFDAWAFDAATPESIVTYWRAPDNLVYSLTPTVNWAPASTNTGVVRWTFGFSLVAAGDQADEALTTISIDSTGPGAVDQRVATAGAVQTLTAGSLYKIIIRRWADNAADTFTADAWFMGLQLDYLIKA